MMQAKTADGDMQVAQNTPRTDGREKITRRKLSDQVLDKLHGMIATGALAAGDVMPSERALMDRFGVGRPAVREALQSLHNSGLITINHGERSRVNAVDASTVLTQSDDIARLVLSSAPANLDHLKQARRMFELGLVRVAAQTATADVVADLRGLVVRQRDCLAMPLGLSRLTLPFTNALPKPREIRSSPLFPRRC